MKFTRVSQSGFAIAGVAVALAILAAIGIGLTQLVATNAGGQAVEATMNQNFYVSHAAFEHAMRRIKVDGVTTIPSRNFLSSSIGVTRTGGKVLSTTSFGGGRYIASSSFSIFDPGSASGPSCIYILNGSSSGAVSITGSGKIGSSTCGMYVNSSNSQAISIVGSGTINSYFVNIVGNYSVVGSGSITTHSGTVSTGASAVADPLLAYNIPSYASCDFTNKTILSNTTLNPGVYCGGINIVGAPTVTLNPGNYILDGGSFSSTGSAIISGTGVTIFLNKQIQGSYATFNLTMSGGSVTLTAPTSGTYAGIAIFQSRNAPSGSDSIVGTTSLQINGAVYFPNQSLTYVGGSSASPPCTMIVAGKLSVTGSANVSCTSGALSGLVH